MRRPVLQLALFVLLSYVSLPSSAARKVMSSGGLASFCSHTTYPGICTSAMKPFAGEHRGGLDAEALLKMHLGAISHRSESASREAKKLMRNAKPGARGKLKHCAALYRTKWDMVGVTMRELHSKDEQTKQMVRIMLQLLRQSAQECDLQFQQSRMSNPLARFNRSIFKLATNSDDLTNMMT
jgi:pectinesterase inhibitor-like protein